MFNFYLLSKSKQYIQNLLNNSHFKVIFYKNEWMCEQSVKLSPEQWNFHAMRCDASQWDRQQNFMRYFLRDKLHATLVHNIKTSHLNISNRNFRATSYNLHMFQFCFVYIPKSGIKLIFNIKSILIILITK